MKRPERLSLAQRPTPVQKLERLSRDLGKEVWLWRDDLTGMAESGNKIRKLEFLLADAMQSGATRVITCGGPQSNHARATAVLARRLGLEVTLVVREPKEGMDPEEIPTGNLLISRMLGADFRFVPFATYREAGSIYDPFLEEEKNRSKERGETPYVIPEGGSCALGAFGYLAAMEELATTWKSQGPGTERPDQLFCALGSGGTLAGLVLGFEALGWSSSDVCAVNVCDDEAYFQKRVSRQLEDTVETFGVSWSGKSLTIFDGHVGEGYAKATDDDLRFYCDLARREGMILDPVYTGKAFQGMLREVRRDPGRFGDRLCFLHSGGLFAHFAFAERLGKLSR